MKMNKIQKIRINLQTSLKDLTQFSLGLIHFESLPRLLMQLEVAFSSVNITI